MLRTLFCDTHGMYILCNIQTRLTATNSIIIVYYTLCIIHSHNLSVRYLVVSFRLLCTLHSATHAYGKNIQNKKSVHGASMHIHT